MSWCEDVSALVQQGERLACFVELCFCLPESPFYFNFVCFLHPSNVLATVFLTVSRPPCRRP